MRPMHLLLSAAPNILAGSVSFPETQRATLAGSNSHLFARTSSYSNLCFLTGIVKPGPRGGTSLRRKKYGPQFSIFQSVD
jgi:hypothetical protein